MLCQEKSHEKALIKSVVSAKKKFPAFFKQAFRGYYLGVHFFAHRGFDDRQGVIERIARIYVNDVEGLLPFWLHIKGLRITSRVSFVKPLEKEELISQAAFL